MRQENGAYLDRIDHLRFFAALMVFFRHFNGGSSYSGSLSTVSDVIGFIFSIGVTGVSLFLFMSGFLFCIICKAGEKKIDYAGFMRNRALRILPLLVFTVFVIISINFKKSSPEDIFRLLTMQLNTGGVSWGMDKFNAWPIWTIAVEFQFYLIFPFIITAFKNGGIKYISSLMLVMLIVRGIIIQTQPEISGDVIYNSLIGRLDQFLIGIIFGKLYIDGRFSLLKNTYISVLSMLTSISLILIYFYIRKPYIGYANAFGFIIEAFAWGFFVMSYLNSKFVINRYINLALSRLGEISFSFYLLHFPIMAALISALTQYIPYAYHGNEMIFTVLLGLPVVCIVSMLTFYTIESPFLGMRKKYSK